MGKSNMITRREAIKTLGLAALGIGVANSTFAAKQTEALNMDRKWKVLLVNGSPNEKGCTFTALNEVGAALNQNDIATEIFQVGRDPMIGCLGCGICFKTKRCFYDGDSVNRFLDKAGGFDGFVFGSPVHFAAISGSMKSFMDRAFFSTLHDNPFQGKIAATLVSARRSGTTSALDQLNKYPIHRGMPLVACQYWPMVYGTKPEEVREDAEGMRIMRLLGNNMAWMLKAAAAGERVGLTPPAYAVRPRSNITK